MLSPRIRKQLTLGIVYLTVFLLTVGLTQGIFLKNIEFKIRDCLFIIRNRLIPQEIPKNIVIVAIDESSFQELKIPWPWPRSLHARLVDQLKEAGAGLIVFDIVFADPMGPEEDSVLRDSIERAGNVILASELEIIEDRLVKRRQFILPIEEFRRGSLNTGLATVTPDPDGFVRKTLLRIEGVDILGYVVAKEYLNRLGGDKDLDIDDLTRPIVIDYLGPSRSIKTVSYYQALDFKEYLPEDFFRDKIVFVGLQLEATPDLTTKVLDSFPVPFFSVSHSRMFGVEIQANVVRTLLEKERIRELRPNYGLLLLFMLLVLYGFLIWKPSPLVGAIFTIPLLTLYFVLCVWFFIDKKMFLPVLPPFSQVLLVYVGTIVNKYFVVERIAMYDPLTGVLNRRSLEIQLERSIKLARRRDYPLTLAMADIDHFKSVNDTYGHQVGDIVLKKIAHILKTNLKDYDIVGRYGGEEFVIILPQTDIEKAKDVLERLRETIAGAKIEQVPNGVTASFGAALLLRDEDGKALIKKADDFLYAAKTGGRNRVVGFVEEGK